MKEGEEEDAKKVKTEADLLEEEQIKKEAEIKREESRIKRENIWKKRTVRNSCPELLPFKKLNGIFSSQATFSRNLRKKNFSGWFQVRRSSCSLLEEKSREGSRRRLITLLQLTKYITLSLPPVTSNVDCNELFCKPRLKRQPQMQRADSNHHHEHGMNLSEEEYIQ